MIDLTIIYYTLLILLAGFNVFLIKHIQIKEPLAPVTPKQELYRQSAIESFSAWWHRFGFAIRGFIVLGIWLNGRDVIVTLTGWFLGWVGYNIIIALGLGQKWDYLGTKGIDKILNKIRIWIKNLFKK